MSVFVNLQSIISVLYISIGLLTRRNMQKYEMMLMLFPNLGEKITQEVLSEVSELINSLGGSIFDEDIWGVRDLAYTIKKQEQAYYVVWNMDFPGKNISELETNLNINQNVMRYLMVRTPVDYELVSLEAYTEAAEAEDAEKEKEKAEKEEIKKSKMAPKKTTKVVEKPVKKEKAEKAKLEDVDAKLKSIIDDPDISL